jgi:flagellar biosynthesis protein FlhG
LRRFYCVDIGHEKLNSKQKNRSSQAISMTQIYPIGGGKGGVGKSFIASCLGAILAQQGHNVALIDLDLGASNLHTIFGIANPVTGIERYLDKTTSRLDETAVATVIPNLDLISSANCSMEIANIYHAQKLKIIRAIHNLPYDFVVLDLGAGTHFNTLDFFLSSSRGMFVCTPEPTSIENAFRFIKAAYLRKLKHIIKSHAFNTIVKAAAEDLQTSNYRPQDVIQLVLQHDPDKRVYLSAQLQQFQFGFVINQIHRAMDFKLGQKIESVLNRHFYSTFRFLGSIRYDERVMEAVVAKNLYVHKFPYTQTAVDLKTITKQINNVPMESLPPRIN